MTNPESVPSKTKLYFYPSVAVLQTTHRMCVDHQSQEILALTPSFLTVFPGFNMWSGHTWKTILKSKILSLQILSATAAITEAQYLRKSQT